jgi:arabinogalactan endo-1,4-beta-galactosidase
MLGVLLTSLALVVPGGADISMLPALEQHGVIYRDDAGRPADAVAILRAHGCEYFRVRIFVDPTDDFSKNYGAVQDLEQMRALCKRIDAAGGKILLSLHYSDTWADPKAQGIPAAWAGLDFDAMVVRVHEYTAQVLAELAKDGVVPHSVQIGNEITAGMLWPVGKITGKGGTREQAESFGRLAALINAGARAVREASTPERPIRVAVHPHGGGTEVAKWFFTELAKHQVDYDEAALSFYPQWNDDLEKLRENLAFIINTLDKDVVIAETGYPWREFEYPESARATLRWPLTPEGQVAFLLDLEGVIAGAPGGRCGAWYWWYPEARPLDVHQVYMGGAGSLFDAEGKALPGMGQMRR